MLGWRMQTRSLLYQFIKYFLAFLAWPAITLISFGAARVGLLGDDELRDWHGNCAPCIYCTALSFLLRRELQFVVLPGIKQTYFHDYQSMSALQLSLFSIGNAQPSKRFLFLCTY